MKTLAGYSDKISVAAGDTISFFVTSEDDMPYQARLVRMINGDINPAGPGFKAEVLEAGLHSEHPGKCQPIYAGSYAYVAQPDALVRLSSFTLQLIAWPTTVHKGEQVLLAHWDGTRGFQLVIDQAGGACIRISDGGEVASVSTGRSLHDRRWYRLSATYDAVTGRLSVAQANLGEPQDGGQSASATGTGSFSPASNAYVTMAALQLNGGESWSHYNGKLEAPRIAGRALDIDHATLAVEDAIAAWDFSLDMETETVRDISANAMHGRLVHMPTRAMTGHDWTGGEMCWRNDPDQYGAIHFHDDDVYDAGWEKSFEWQVPSELKSGIYCAHISNSSDEDYIPFVIRAPRGSASGKLLFLMPSASYMAYANEHVPTDAALAELLTTKLTVFRSHDLFLSTHREYGNSMYDMHTDLSGVAYSSRLRPILNMRPSSQTGPGATGSGVWQFSADLHIIDFLEHSGLDYDVITDEDLHHEGVEILEGYRCVITGSHPEYYSKQMLDAIDQFKQAGGRLVYMGGNGFYWRVAFHPTAPGIIELRRAEDGIRTWLSAPGEYYHSFTGEYGGLWLRNGRPPQALVGVGTTAQGFDVSSYYRRTENSHDPRAAFIFRNVEDEIIGDFGLIGGGAAGSELDRADLSLGTPRHALILATSEMHSDAYLMVPEDVYAMTMNTGGAENPLVHADMVFFETAAGGAVFSTGSIAWSGSLSHNRYDNNVAHITLNVLQRFLEETPFEI